MSDHPNYRKPPKETQFKPGKSGNPGGRPKKRPTLRDALEEALDQEMSVVVAGRREMRPAREIIANAVIGHLIKKPGDVPQLARWLEGERPTGPNGEPQDPQMDEALLKDHVRRATRNRRTGGSDDGQS